MPWSTGWPAHSHASQGTAEQRFREKLQQATKPEVDQKHKEALFQAVTRSINTRWHTRPYMTVDVLKERMMRRDPRISSLTLELIDACLRDCGQGRMRELVAEKLMDNIVEIASSNAGSREMPVNVRDQAFHLLEKWARTQEISSRSPGYQAAHAKALKLRRARLQSPRNSPPTSAYATVSARKSPSGQPRPTYPSVSLSVPSSAAAHLPPPPDYPAPPTPPASAAPSSASSTASGSLHSTNPFTNQENFDSDVAAMLKASRRMLMSVSLDPNLIGRETHQQWKAEYDAEQRVAQRQQQMQHQQPSQQQSQQQSQQLQSQIPMSAQPYAYYNTANMNPHQYQSMYGHYHSTPGSHHMPSHHSTPLQHSPPSYGTTRPVYSPGYPTTVPVPGSRTNYPSPFATVQGNAEPPPYTRVQGYGTVTPRGLNADNKARKTSHRRSRSHDLTDVTISPVAQNDTKRPTAAAGGGGEAGRKA